MISEPTEFVMTDNIENLLLEHMKRFQVSIDRVDRRQEELIFRTSQVEQSVAGLRRDFALSEVGIAGMSVRLDRLDERLERIERRLELVG
jgi:hypothetical protein